MAEHRLRSEGDRVGDVCVQHLSNSRTFNRLK